jgi:hypothetical protein
MNRVDQAQARIQSTAGFTSNIRAQGRAREIRADGNVAADKAEARLGFSWRDAAGPSGMKTGAAPASTLPDFLAPGGGGKKGGGGKSAEQVAREAERRREEALRRQYQFESDERRGQIDTLRAQESLTHDYSERTSIALAILDLERKQEIAANQQTVSMGERSRAEADQLLASYDRTDSLRRQAMIDDEQYARREDVLRIEEARFDIERDALTGESQLAETAAERRAVELRILDLAYRQEKARLDAVVADERASFGEREAARQRLGGLDARRTSDAESVRRGTRGPLEAYLASLPDTAAKANEALEAVAANGISSLVDGLAEAGTNVKKLGSLFSSVARQILIDLARIQIQKSVASGLSSVISGIGAAFGSGGHTFDLGGVNSLVASHQGFKVPGFATGGSFTIGGRRGYDTNLLSLNGAPIARVSHGERVAISPTGEATPQRILLEVAGSDLLQVRMIEVGRGAAEVAIQHTNRTIKGLGRQRL